MKDQSINIEEYEELMTKFIKKDLATQLNYLRIQDEKLMKILEDYVKLNLDLKVQSFFDKIHVRIENILEFKNLEV